MPRFRPTRHFYRKVGLPYAAWFVSMPMQDKQGVIVKKDDGTFDWLDPMHPSALTGTVYQIGNEEYYLSLAEAREAISNSNLHDIEYTDDYNDEYQDHYVCNLAYNSPDTPASIAEPIQ